MRALRAARSAESELAGEGAASPLVSVVSPLGEGNHDEPSVRAEASTGGSSLSVPTVEEIRTAIDEVQDLWESAGTFVTFNNRTGVTTVTAEGFALEAATVRVGEMLSSRADSQIEESMAAVRAEYALLDGIDLSMVTFPEAMLQMRLGEMEAILEEAMEQQADGAGGWDSSLPEMQAMVENMRASLDACRSLKEAGIDVGEIQRKVAAIREDAYLAVLREVREMGTADGVKFYYEYGTDKGDDVAAYYDETEFQKVMKERDTLREQYGEVFDVESTILSASHVFPSDWWEQVNESDVALRVEAKVGSFGGYHPRGGLSLGEDPRMAEVVAKHELTHRMEMEVTRIVDGVVTHPIAELEEVFIVRRTTEEPGMELDRSQESVRVFDALLNPDHFAHIYVGRFYPSRTEAPVQAREVMAMGQEALFAGTNGGLVGDSGFPPDRDHRALALGILATVGRKVSSRTA